MTGTLAAVDSGYRAAQRRAYTPMPPKPNPHLAAIVIPGETETPGTPDMMTRPTHIAILDDDQSVRTAIGRVLRMSEMTVDSCGTSLELFDAMAEKSPDCIVLDLQMPGMDGFDVMKYLDRRGVHIPTIIISAQDEPGFRESCIVAGASAYLRKPLDADELLKTIDEAVAAHADC
jgi:CheY-like chemotaxis protein